METVDFSAMGWGGKMVMCHPCSLSSPGTILWEKEECSCNTDWGKSTLKSDWQTLLILNFCDKHVSRVLLRNLKIPLFNFHWVVTVDYFCLTGRVYSLVPVNWKKWEPCSAWASSFWNWNLQVVAISSWLELQLCWMQIFWTTTSSGKMLKGESEMFQVYLIQASWWSRSMSPWQTENKDELPSDGRLNCTVRKAQLGASQILKKSKGCPM